MKPMIQVSAPGSLMLMGEHAVLHGRRALVCAVNRRLRVRVQPRKDDQVRLHSHLGRLELALDHVRPIPPFQFVLAAIRRYRGRLTGGLDLRIESEFSSTVGLGSSAAVTVATCAALERLTGGRPGRPALLRTAREVVREVQGLGSGADVAASVYGGVLAYRAAPLEVRELRRMAPIIVLYSGGKTPTVEVVRRVRAAREKHPRLFNTLYDLMDETCAQAVPVVRRGDWERFGELLNLHQGLLDALGVNNAKLSELVYALRAEPGVFGAKISGSGLGDCVIGLGTSRRRRWPGVRIPATMDSKGVCFEKA